ncbi:hypothetical protein CGRA01v4_04759 [Colletotrichum graminicola]|uniref:CorA-like Mg2+ transporter n=1 Tax=Colletotrichum graminicola (strain M1.001 / M2 / FGSC 10212) TaxID=645133 RepID=E3QLJ7_COLGM|nr:uncharacterized protein GLRG_06710 [Colletotrichum graminicola M1.001]EFQ31735.1 hypothetical protein GLRG_06710 [Colletotrichum graminicola M1.001]WDK13478.1 hypothetical protein CGRA01v4_04759 [Colletotrichum graminicola]
MEQNPCSNPACTDLVFRCWKKGDGNEWEITTRAAGDKSRRLLPTREFNVCIVEAKAQKIRECPVCKRHFAETFAIPDLWWKKYCRDSNGYFGYQTTIDDDGNTTALNTWARFPVKLTNSEHPGYEWFKLNVFTRWLPSRQQTILIIFDLRTPAASCMTRVPESELDPLFTIPDPSYFIDPYWIYIQLLEKVVTMQDAAVWAVRDTVRTTEKQRDVVNSSGESMPKPTPDYRHLHETARHAIHVSETLDLGVTAARKILAQHQSLKDESGAGARQEAAWNKAWHHTHQRLQFFEEMLSSLQERSASNKARHFNEISLAYNMVAQFDSRVSVAIGRATQRDSEAMKTIAFLTLLFLPATFVSAVFSTSFFNFDSESGSWQVSDQFWIYWAVAVPITAVTAVLWCYRPHFTLFGVLDSLQKNRVSSDADFDIENEPVYSFASSGLIQKRKA